MFFKTSFVIVLIVHNVHGLDPLVETEVGLIKGAKGDDGDYYMFLGIPYAAVDYTNPFGPSTPYPAFNETYEALQEYGRCPQVVSFTNTAAGSLDCLHLNVYVPSNAKTDDSLPVIVNIHGGTFVESFGSKTVYGPKFLIKHDIILVSFNYRVGVYGFMCLGTPEVPGNQGLKDQQMALKWVRTNIKGFGGDPNRVTILGESAGARSVDYHLMAENQNLFNKVILQSGNALSALQATPATGEVNPQQPITLAKYLGFETDDFREALAFLSTLDPIDVVRIATDHGVFYKPCVENDLEGVTPFVTDYTINREIPNVRKMPILIGFNDNERYFAHASKGDSDYKGLDFFVPFLKSYFVFDDEQLEYYEKAVRRFYIGDEELSAALKQEIADADSDFTYVYSIQRRIAQFRANGAEKIYQYVFSYNGRRNLMQVRDNITAKGAVHADELGYLFESDILSSLPICSKDQRMIDRMTTMWTNFAKYGDPTPETSDLLPFKWEPITDENWYYYSFDSKISLERRPFNQRMAFLDLLFDMNEKYQVGYPRTAKSS